jgi:hypothetical protein
MTVHPLSICRQLGFEFEDVRSARFEYDGWDIVYRVELEDGTSGHSRTDIFDHIARHSSMGIRPRLEPWAPGPTWPPAFGQFSEEQLQLLEASDPTHDGLEAAVRQAFDFAADVTSDTPTPGEVRLTISSLSELSDEQLRACERFATAVLAAPGAKATVVQGTVAPNPDSGMNLPFMVHQASRDGVVDSTILRALRDDEDTYRQARVSRFSTAFEAPQGLSVYLPVDGSRLDLRQIIPLYDFAYFPIEVFGDADMAYGITWHDALELVRRRRLVGVITRRVGEYDQRKVRELLDAGGVLLPRKLATATAASILDSNPLWRLSQLDPKLARAILHDVRSGVSSSGVPKEIASAIMAWVEFQSDGAINFEAGALHQAAMLPMSYGPGALAAKLLRVTHGSKAPDLEAAIIGMHVTHSMALGAGCVPLPDKSLYPFYELTTLATAAREAGVSDLALKKLPVIAELDRILTAIAFETQADVPITRWIDETSATMDALRDGISSAFAITDSSTLEGVAQRAAKLEWELANLAANRASLSRTVERFEIVGLAADSVAWLADTAFPFAGTLIGVLIKRGVPRLWDHLSKNPHSAAALDVLEGVGARTYPNVVRLHRIVSKHNKKG